MRPYPVVMRGVRFVMVVAATGLAALLLAGCSSSAGGAQPSTPAQVGGGWDFSTPEGGGRVTMHGAGWHADDGGAFPSPARQGAYLVMDVEVRVDSGSYLVSELDWDAYDAEGRVWSCVNAHRFPPGFPSMTVKAGERVRGNVACDVPRGVMVVKVGGGPAWEVPA